MEWLGIGRIGSRRCKPRWQADELAKELLVVLSGADAAKMKQRAREVAAMCRDRGDGAIIAARFILEQIT